MNLNPRQQKILWATVRHYISTAEPVGSKALVEEYDLRVSSATIRNSFSSLEKAGLLYQPHTSAGRVPSDSGYRLYVDQLLQPDPLAAQQAQQQLSTQLNWENWSLEALLRGAAQILATLSGYIAIVTPPTAPDLPIRHWQLLPLEGDRLMVVVVFNTYDSLSVVAELPPTNLSSQQIHSEIQTLAGLLARRACAQGLAELLALDWEAFLGTNLRRYLPALKQALASLKQHHYPRSQVMMRGFAQVLRQPEFAELQQVETLLQLLEAEPEEIWPLLAANGSVNAESRISIRIGAENPWEPMHICTLVSSPYCPDGRSIGSVSLLGPKRMLYENVIPFVQSTANYMSQALAPDQRAMPTGS
jgi:heat-inducible transcriptional repressor